ncbi:MAG: twin-arginine translocase subunit TatC [Myxococcota bacterium]|nr:twin-arginine translocase subunit TatC [Myxococcota bacterium]MDW8361001.1 twin-arginine translocase subunit TatC [Myxococcales bacterium]
MKPSAPTPDRPEDDVEMGFFDHLAELRRRLLRALVGMIPTVAVGWAYKEQIMQWLVAPLALAWRRLGMGTPSLHFANPVDPFLAYLKVSLVAGLLLASPWIFWQLWAFVAPGLYRRERRLAVPFVLASTVCFAGGAIFGYVVVLPFGFETLLSFAGPLPDGAGSLQPTLMVDEYLGFAVKMLVAFGLSFEVPVVTTFLAAAGIVDWRALLRFGRWWLVAAAVLAAILTPPDVGSQLLMLGPLVGLYYLGVLLAFLIGRRVERADAEAVEQAGSTR